MAKGMLWTATTLILLGTALVTGNTWSEGDEWLSWSQWMTHMISKGVYLVLIFLITMCVAFSTIKNKIGGGSKRNPDMDEPGKEGWVSSFCRGTTGGNHPLVASSNNPVQLSLRKLFYNRGDFQVSEENLRIKDQLKETQTTIALLKEELEISNKQVSDGGFLNEPETYRNFCQTLLTVSQARIKLEESLEVMDKDKTSVEDLLHSSKYQGSMEMEKMKREHASARRQLQQALVERDQLGKEVEALQREARIVASALRDNQVMDLRLEEARREIAELKMQMERMKAEKDIAVHVVDEIISAKGHLTALPRHIKTTIASSLAEDQGREVIDEDKEMAARLLAEVARTRLNMTDTFRGTPADLHNGEEYGDILRSSPLRGMDKNEEEIEPDKLSSYGDGPIIGTLFNKHTSSIAEDLGPDYLVVEDPGPEDSLLDLEDLEDMEDDDDSASGLVTGSEAFRKFLQNNPLFPAPE